MRSLFVFAALFVGLVSAARADFNAAMSAYEGKDYAEAAKEFQALAEQGDADAQFMLGYLYTSGEGVLQDYVQAHKWFNLAASKGRKGARKARDEIAKRMTQDQVAEAQRLAREWRPRPVEAEYGAPSQRVPTEPTEPALEMSRDEIARIQAMLTELGYGSGAADGVVGPRTRSAIRSYQAAVGLPVDGEPSKVLLEHLAEAYSAKREQEAPRPKVVEEAAKEEYRDQALVDRLHKLVTDAERGGMGRNWFLDKLWGLLREYEGPWRHRIMVDDFSDGNYTANPTWKVAAGQFLVEKDLGLRSTVTAPAPRQEPRETRPEDIAKAILGAILEEAAPREAPQEGTVERGYGEIHVARKLPNAFAVHLTMTSREKAGRIEFGPYQGIDRGVGYRVAYIPRAQKGLELLSASSSGSAVIDVYPKPLNLEDGQPHVVEWTRSQTGEMVVSVDGRRVLGVIDRRFGDPFDGFTLVNRGGDYGVRKVMIFGVESTP